MSIFDGVIAPFIRVEYDSEPPLGPKEPESITWASFPTDTIRSISIRRGKTQENQVVQPGECTITFDNRSGNFDPMNESSPYRVSLISPYGSYSLLSTNLCIRVIATWDEVDYTLYTGYLEQVSMDYGLNPTTTITFVDALAWLAKQDLAAIPSKDPITDDPIPAVGLGDQVWFRVNSALDPNDEVTGYEGCDFPAGLRGIDESVDNTLYGTRYGSDVLSLMQTWADCGPARLFVDVDGLVRLLSWDGGDDSALVLSDEPSDETSIGYDQIEVEPGSRYLLNFVTVNKIDGNGDFRGAVSAVDEVSELRFGPIQATYDLPTNTAEPVATFLANQYSEPIDRVHHISFPHLGLGSNFVKTLVTDIPDFITVVRNTYDGRTLTFSCQVEGMEHDISPDNWRAGYICSTLSVETAWAASISPLV